MTDSANALEITKVRQWEQYDWLRHGFSTRAGGVSSVYGGTTLNLGWTKEDDADAITENRRRFVDAVAHQQQPGTPFTLVGVRQVHEATIHALHPSDGALEGRLATPEGKAVLEGDGLITSQPGVLIAVGTADCVPVLVVDVSKRVVAAFHAGWRGTAARIVELGIAKMRQDYGSRPEDLLAAVGPSIGACCYTVGDEVHTQFQSIFPYAATLFHEGLHLDLWQANRHQLIDAGLEERQIAIIGECTACSRTPQGEMRYFSHRGEHGVAGRMLNAIGITQ
jgi:YfiH family protein